MDLFWNRCISGKEIKLIVAINQYWAVSQICCKFEVKFLCIMEKLIFRYGIFYPITSWDLLFYRTNVTLSIEGAGWDYGSNLEYLKELINYWQNEFDWRIQEEAINKFSHFRADIDGLNIHFIHQPGKGKNPMPLLLLHGWPYSFLQMLNMGIKLLQFTI